MGDVAAAERAGQRDPDMDFDFPRRCGFCVTEFRTPGSGAAVDLGDLRSLSVDISLH